MACANNGRLSLSTLTKIPNGYLSDDAARSYMAMRAYIIAHGGPVIGKTLGPDATYRTINRQQFWKNYWCGQGHCERAAAVGYSNHGCGVAFDENDPAAQHWIRWCMHKFGWSDAEGLAVGENWHFRYVGGYKGRPDPLRHLTPREKRWVTEYVQLKRANKDRGRRRVLRRYMRRQRKAIWREAQKSGWKTHHRKERYNVLRRYS